MAALTLQEAKASGGDAVRFAGSIRLEAPAETRTFDVLQGLILAVDTKDRYTKRHSEDVARYGIFLAERLELPPELVATIRVAGLLHDVGKIGIPDQILRKPGPLTDEEYDVVKQHVALGDMIVRDLPDVDLIRAGVRHHHERWDGNGLPRPPGRRGDPADRPDPGRRRCVLGDDDDSAVSQGPRRARGADAGSGDAAGSQLDERLVPASSSRASRRPPMRRCPAIDVQPLGLWTPVPTGRLTMRGRPSLARSARRSGCWSSAVSRRQAPAATWQIARRRPPSTEGNATTISVVVLEPRRSHLQDDLGCVRIPIPAAFDVGSATVTDEPAGTVWSASTVAARP